MNHKFYFIVMICVIAVLTIATPIVHAQVAPSGSAPSVTSTNQIPPLPPPPVLPERPVPTLFDIPTSTQMERPTSTPPMPQPPQPQPQHEDATSTRQDMNPMPMPPKQEMGAQNSQNDQEDVVVSSTDTPAMRLKKLARYWAVYRELGSTSMYAITVSGTKREIKTLDFFNKIESNFGMRLMPKGSLDQFTTGDAITSVDGLDLSSFRKLAQPCRLIKTADKPVVYLACLGIKRAILNEKAFKMFGWDFKQVQTVGSNDVGTMKDGDSVSEATIFDQGIQIDAPVNQDSSTTSVQKKGEEPKKNLPTGATTQLKVARIIKLQGDTKIYVITADGKRHRVLNMDVVRSLRLDLSKVQTVTEEQFKAYPEGEALSLGTGGNESAPKNPPMGAPVMNGAPTSTTPMPMPPMNPEQPRPTSTQSTMKVGHILKLRGGDAVYLVIADEKIKHRIYSTQLLAQMGLKIEPMKEIGQADLDAYQNGDAIGAPSTTDTTSTSTTSTASEG